MMRPSLPNPPPGTTDAWDDTMHVQPPTAAWNDSAAVVASSREIELAAKNDVLHRTAAELAAEVWWVMALKMGSSGLSKVWEVDRSSRGFFTGGKIQLSAQGQ